MIFLIISQNQLLTTDTFLWEIKLTMVEYLKKLVKNYF